ncbi:hypothetical protein DID88_009033 [Monilinia fructigena]|uniref:Uncharacterized protein n=1 Tax=Monilinia fructigena TaxID=38457 RepID=A0A395IGF2_9HELO|nr:hypothetical protein DID88_009033 [Monilinia fructigena]
MPTQASLGVGIIQTAYRLSITIGLAITSAVFNTAASGKASTEDANLSYRRVYICSIIFAAISLSTIPFMYIETRARDNANVSTSTTTIMPETNSSTTVNQSPSNNHSTPHGVGTFLDRIARFRTEELSGSLRITRSLPLTRPNRPSPLNLKINEQPHHEYQEGISNTQRYDPSLSRARTMNDIAQGLFQPSKMELGVSTTSRILEKS